MISNEERIQKMHERARELKRRRDKMIITASAVLSACLCLILIGVIAISSVPSGGYTGNPYAGASLLDSSVAGGYILTAVLAFMAGVVITVAIRRYRDIDKEKNVDKM
ncbi:MAG: hypothetical protein IK111_09565 [Lachnospiraceae bacterium]|nr:hypothetical protein [Lachnospiraceae bacterium]